MHELSSKFQLECWLKEPELIVCKQKLSEFQSTEDFETCLMIEYTDVYVELLKATGRGDEVEAVEAQDHWEGMSHYIKNVLEPYLHLVWNELQLHQGKKFKVPTSKIG